MHMRALLVPRWNRARQALSLGHFPPMAVGIEVYASRNQHKRKGNARDPGGPEKIAFYSQLSNPTQDMFRSA